ncbi:MAG: glycosyltransferase family 10 [Aestuariivita sp.]|nr:glycosyltransferase family 10 [Aestuariivita sp.]
MGEVPGAIYHQPGLNWHIGTPGGNDCGGVLNFEQIAGLFNQPKAKLMSVICSGNTSSPQHRERLKFARRLKDHFGCKIDFFGRGIATMADKLEALGDYRFHVVLENCSREHYFSEKLADCILAGAYPIYYGCPNLDRYFPENSYRRIDIRDFGDSASVICGAVNGDLDRKFRPALLEARDLILHRYNLYPMLVSLVEGIEAGKYGPPNRTRDSQNPTLMPLTRANGSSSVRSALSGLAGMVWRKSKK